MWVEPRSTWRMCAEGCLGGEAEWVARGGVEVLRSVITMIGPWINDLRRCHVEVRRLEPAGGERPAPLEKRVWIDALEEAHGEWMREKARGRAERSVGLLLTTGGSRRCLRGRQLPARARREAAEALNIKHTETNRTPHTPEM